MALQRRGGPFPAVVESSICANDRLLPMVATDQALLEALEEELLDPAVIARTIEKAVAELQRDETGSSATAERVRHELATVEAQLGRLTLAIVLGGDLPRLVAALDSRPKPLQIWAFDSRPKPVVSADGHALGPKASAFLRGE